MSGLLRLEAVTVRQGREPRNAVAVLKRVDLTVAERERVAVIGTPARSGKSALMRVLAGALPPDEGRVLCAGRSLYEISDRERSALVRDMVGLADPASVELTRCDRVVELVGLALLSGRVSMRQAQIQARRALSRVGASACADLRPVELTRGERVRVSIARALVREPRVLLIDEPAALPDPDEVDDIIRMVRSVARDLGAALVVATQDPLALVGGWDQMVHVSDGELTSSERDGVLVPFPHRNSA